MRFRGSIAYRFVFAVIAMVGIPAGARAQAKPFGIVDNSFLVEEAFNQDPGIFQNIFTWTRGEAGGWEGSFTQEWPAPALTHQVSYSVPFIGGDGTPTHVGGAVINYRYQAMTEAPGRPAFAPRAGLILPTGRSEDDSDRVGVQVNLPFSKQVGALYLHWNAGFIWLQGIPLGTVDRTNLTSPQIAASLVWNARPLFNVLLESTVGFEDAVRADLRTHRERIITVSPGVRGGWNLGDTQIVVGAALPLTVEEGERDIALLTYFSCELPFTDNR